MQYLHLVWAETYLSRSGGTDELKKSILAGENLFHDQIGKVTSAKSSGLLQILPFEPHDDLETWERFWLDKKPDNTYKLWRTLQENPVLEHQDESPLNARNYRLRQAWKKYGYFEWEAEHLNSSTLKHYSPSGFDFNLNSSTSTTTARRRIMSGLDACVVCTIRQKEVRLPT